MMSYFSIWKTTNLPASAGSGLVLSITYFFPESDIVDEVDGLFVDLKNLDPLDAKMIIEGLENSDDESRRYIVSLVNVMASKPLSGR